MSRGVRLTGHRLVRAPVQRVWHLLSRPEIHPRYTTMWMAADVLERSPTGALVEFRGFFGGLPIVSVQRLAMKPPWRLEFRQIRGELRDLSGAYVLKDIEGETDLSCEIVVDAGIALFSDIAVEQILAGHTEGTLGRLKTTAERDLVRLISRRSRLGAATASVGESRDADEGAEDQSTLPSTTPAPLVEEAGEDHPPADVLETDDEQAPAASHAADTGPISAVASTPAVAPTAAGRSDQPSDHRRRRRRRRGRRRPGSGTPQDAAGPAGAPPASR